MLETISSTFPVLTLLVALPALAGVLILSVKPLQKAGRYIALGVSVVELLLVLFATTQIDWTLAGSYQLAETYSWIPQIGISWALGVTQLSLVMIVLALALVPLVLVAAWKEDSQAANPSLEAGRYAALILLLEAFMVLIFAARDVAVFYFAFEAMLIPLYFMIGRYGIANAKAAAVKFLLYSLAGGLVMLAGVITLFVYAERTPQAYLLENLSQTQLPFNVELGIFITFFIAFAIKAPMVPLHTWLPDTAAAARPGTSVLLVGVLDKIGTYGMIALCLPLFPNASVYAAPVIIGLALVSIIYGGLAAIGQSDLMRLVSFTSVSHFGFMVLGIYVGSTIAMTGAMFYMVAHGVSIAAMFLISGYLTEQTGSRAIADYRGMQRVTPILAGTWLVSGLASVALPGLSGFVPEYLVLIGTWKVLPIAAAVAVFGVVLAALYLLVPYQKIFTGPVPDNMDKFSDLDMRQKFTVAPLLIAMVILGIWSAPLISALTPVSEAAVTNFQSAPLENAQTEGNSK
ncbi:NADH-quinone oxidoreductase subunit M [Gleimia sp. 6138-11-ORH1]|uniref:NADH-quinone oxidoreductase subunit M n=1 Tax=Gleimia sp. 6138-11-ORH1 TaxID=2973937 RepID=UPI002168E300|nr:NADH-quinone oxidoreductase subunit M [Gleimia sp. 6138-11-ORH1]MCS4484651.1 NADH-quinone oxidoreductase subunit M [Gleimia sp. 6138-11-ORH1]